MSFRPLSLLFVLLLAASAVAEDVPRRSLHPDLAALFEQHCLRCHGPKKAEGDFRIDQLGSDLDNRKTFTAWANVVKRIKSGKMPPEDEPRPDPAQVASVVKKIDTVLDYYALKRRESGRTVLRRLNRVEYENTVRDLFAVDVAVKELLPEDTIAHGFDTIGSALNVSPVLMERYLEAADAVLSAATAPRASIPSKVEVFELNDSLPEYFRGAVLRREKDVVLFRSDGSPSQLAKFRARAAGRYRFKISASAHQSNVPLAMGVLVGNFNTSYGTAHHLGYFDARPGEPQIIELETYLQQRETIKVTPAALPRVYVKDWPAYPGPGLAIGTIEVEGPLPEVWPSESYRRVFGDIDPRQGTLADAEKLLAAFLPRAFRRPTTAEELAPYLALVKNALESGESFESALRGGYKAILCAPPFLYRKEQPGVLDDYALASRLSYFLWSTLPDEELLKLAAEGKLSGSGSRQNTSGRGGEGESGGKTTQPVANNSPPLSLSPTLPLQNPVLRAQVERMLNHPKAQEFTKNFTGQWLKLRDIDFTTPDRQLYPEFEESLEWSMIEESHAFFNELLKNDLSLLNFVDSDFAMLNARLARHYGIEGVEGVEGVAIRKVAIKPEQNRGGVLTQASVLKVTANGTNTSPVVRGVWVMDAIVGKPVPPPPANVPAIEPDIRGATTIREQLARHREIASCAACHAQFDPAGFALENYDVIGGYREQYRALGTKERVRVPDSNISKFLAKPGYGLGPAVEAGDTLPDGRKFANLQEFKKLLLADPDQIARCLTEKLVVYGTGHGLEYGDHAEIERIVAESRDQKYGFRSLVHLVVASELFRKK